jgi:hypothetical protein
MVDMTAHQGVAEGDSVAASHRRADSAKILLAFYGADEEKFAV